MDYGRLTKNCFYIINCYIYKISLVRLPICHGNNVKKNKNVNLIDINAE